MMNRVRQFTVVWTKKLHNCCMAKRHTLMVVCPNTGNSRDCSLMPRTDRHIRPLQTLA